MSRFRRLLEGASLRPADLSQHVRLPCHGVYVHWQLPEPTPVLEWDLSVIEDPGESTGEYLCLFNGSIDGSAFYLGLQTDVYHPHLGRGIGKGLIFSTWWSFDAADTRLAGDGFRQLGTHEGRFVGIRKPFAWTEGQYRVRLSRGPEDTSRRAVLDWYDLSIEAAERPVEPAPAPDRARTWVGAIRFPRARPDRAATIGPTGTTFMEVYANAETWLSIPRWVVELSTRTGDGARPAARIEFPRFPHGQRMPNVAARQDDARQAILLAFGGDASPAVLPS